MKKNAKSIPHALALKIPVIMLVVALALPSGDLQGQAISGKSIPELRSDTLHATEWSYFRFRAGLNRQSFAFARRSAPSNASVLHRPASVVPTGFYYHSLGFFCKVEVDVARTTSFPIKMRLGEVHYVERLEGKKGYWPY